MLTFNLKYLNLNLDFIAIYPYILQAAEGPSQSYVTAKGTLNVFLEKKNIEKVKINSADTTPPTSNRRTDIKPTHLRIKLCTALQRIGVRSHRYATRLVLP